MNLIIIDKSALSNIDMINLKLFNREHHPVIVVVVDSNGYSQRFKLTEISAESIISDIPNKYLIKK